MTETFTIVNSQPSMVEALEAVQRVAFPTLAEDGIITAAHGAAHIARFLDGQFAVLDAAGQVVGVFHGFSVRPCFSSGITPTMIPPDACSTGMTTREHDVWTGILVHNSTSGPRRCGRNT
jgi:hypothetical protein